MGSSLPDVPPIEDDVELGLAGAGQDTQKGDTPGAALSKWGRNRNCSPGECFSKVPGCEQLNGWKTAVSNVVTEILLLN